MQSLVNHNRKIGIEIEVVLPIVGLGQNFDVQQLVANVLTAQRIPACARGYSHSPVPADCQLAVEHDGSIRDESRYAGIRWAKLEVKTRPMTWTEVEAVMPTALEIINYLGGRINPSCGFHVHHHLPECVEQPQVVRNLQHLWCRFHPVMYGLVAPSRSSNQYCQPPRPADARRLDSVRSYDELRDELLHGPDRYQGLNLNNLADQERMTVEWRIHGGTTEWSKIGLWILATQRWVEHAIQRSCHVKAEPIPNTQQALQSLLITTGLKPNSRIYSQVDKELRNVGKYLLRRWKFLNLPPDFKSKAVA